MGVDPTKLIDATSGWVSRPSTATLSPCSTLNTPSGRPASAQSRAIHNAAEGTFSDGLITTVLPAAMATGKNHIGTMAGKLKGLMIPATPIGARIEDTSTPVEALSVEPPLSRCGIPQANSTTSWPRATLARGVGGDLAVLGGDDLRELSGAGVEQLPEPEHDRRPRGQRGVAPSRERRGRRRHHLRHLVLGGEGHPLGDRAGRGVGDVADVLGGALQLLAARPVGQDLDVGHRLSVTTPPAARHRSRPRRGVAAQGSGRVDTCGGRPGMSTVTTRPAGSPACVTRQQSTSRVPPRTVSTSPPPG